MDEKLFELNFAVDSLKDGKGGIRFDHTAEDLNRMTTETLEYQNAVIDAIKATLDKERNFENVALPFAIRESNGGSVEMVI